MVEASVRICQVSLSICCLCVGNVPECGCRIHPNEVMTFTIDRKGESLEIPVKPAEAPDGTGRIGVQLAANAQVTRNVSKDPLQAVQLAAKQFGKLTKTVVMGRRATEGRCL